MEKEKETVRGVELGCPVDTMSWTIQDLNSRMMSNTSNCIERILYSRGPQAMGYGPLPVSGLLATGPHEWLASVCVCVCTLAPPCGSIAARVVWVLASPRGLHRHQRHHKGRTGTSIATSVAHALTAPFVSRMCSLPCLRHVHTAPFACDSECLTKQ